MIKFSGIALTRRNRFQVSHQNKNPSFLPDFILIYSVGITFKVEAWSRLRAANQRSQNIDFHIFL
jgi:hypothetical protein